MKIIYVFDLAGCKPVQTSAKYIKYIEIYLAKTLQWVVQMTWFFGSMPKIKIYDHLIFYLSLLRKSVDEFANPPGGGVVKNLGNGWSKSFF